MNRFVRCSLMASGFGIFFFTAAPSFATVLDNVYVGGYGQVAIAPLAVNGSSIGLAQMAVPQTVGTYLGGPVPAVSQPIGPYGSFAISPSSPSVAVSYSVSAPVTYSPAVSVTLDSAGPVGSTPCESCSPSVSSSPITFSPIILMAASPGVIVAPSPGAATGAPTLNDVPANFSSAPSETQIEHTASSSAETYAENLAFGPMTPVPEPRFLFVVLLAGLLIGWVIAKRRKSEA